MSKTKKAVAVVVVAIAVAQIAAGMFLAWLAISALWKYVYG